MTWDIGAYEYIEEGMEGTSSVTVAAQGSLQVARDLQGQVTIMVLTEGYLEVVFDTFGPYPDNWDDDEVFG